MSEGAFVGGKFIAALAALPEVERERALSLVRMAFPSAQEDTRRARNRERMRTVRAQANTVGAQNEHQGRTVSSEGVGGVSLSPDSQISDLENLPLSGLSSGDLDYSPGARESGVVPAAPVLHGSFGAPLPRHLEAARWAYEGAVRAVTRGTYGLTIKKLAELQDALVSHCRSDDDTARPASEWPAWIERQMKDFIPYVGTKRRDPKEAAFWNLDPGSFNRWLNDTPIEPPAAIPPDIRALTQGIGKQATR